MRVAGILHKQSMLGNLMSGFLKLSGLIAQAVVHNHCLDVHSLQVLHLLGERGHVLGLSIDPESVVGLMLDGLLLLLASSADLPLRILDHVLAFLLYDIASDE